MGNRTPGILLILAGLALIIIVTINHRSAQEVPPRRPTIRKVPIERETEDQEELPPDIEHDAGG